MAPVTVISPF